MPLPLAFAFASPWMLTGLVLAGLPILIHILHRRNYRETSWAAMRFLLAAARRHSRRLRIEQWVLLAVRTLLLMLLVLAVARPTLENIFATGAAPPTLRVLIVDQSLSVTDRSGTTSRFERLMENAKRIVQEASRGDSFMLLTIRQVEPRTLIEEPTFDRERVRDTLDGLSATAEVGRPEVTLQQLSELLGSVPEGTRKRVYLLSDFQQTNWLPDRSGRGLRTQLRELGREAEWTVINVGDANPSNLAVVDLTADRDLFSRSSPIEVSASILNDSDRPREGVPVEFLIDGESVGQQNIRLEPGETASVTAKLPVPASAGDHRIEVRLPPDRLLADNIRHHAIVVRDRIPVLIVDGGSRSRSRASETRFLRLALAPWEPRSDAEGILQPDVIDAADLSTVVLRRYACVILVNAPVPTPNEVQRLESYVRGGGGLMIAVGNRVDVERYNNSLWGEGESLLPARLADRVGNAEQPTEAWAFDPDPLTHPIVSVFRGNPGTGLESTLTFEYIRAVPDPESSTVPLAFTNGDPALITSEMGQGRVLLMTTAVDNRWSTWAATNASFAPTMLGAVRFLIEPTGTSRQHRVGDRIVRFETRDDLPPVTVLIGPSGDRTPVDWEETGDRRRLVTPPLLESGFHELRIGSNDSEQTIVELHAANVSPIESRLEGLSRREISANLFADEPFEYRRGTDQTLESEAVRRAETLPLARWLLWVVLGLLITEQLLAWHFRTGLLFLLGITAAAGVARLAAGAYFGGGLIVVAATVLGACLLGGGSLTPKKR